MPFETIHIFALLGVVALLIYYYVQLCYEYWKKRNVVGPQPEFFFGNIRDVFFTKISYSDFFMNLYNEYKNEPFVGVFDHLTPNLILRDPDYIKEVLIKDFSKFPDRTLDARNETDPLSQHLFSLEHKRWRPLRIKFSPVFMSAKLKEMFHLLLECSEHFEKYVATLVEKDDAVEVLSLTGRYTTDVIGSCAFGIDMHSMSAEGAVFREIGKAAFYPSVKAIIRDRIRPNHFLFKIFGQFLIETSLLNFFTAITRDTLDHRIKHNVRRHDFFDTLVDMKQHPEKFGIDAPSDVFIAAQAFVFFAAGFETSAMTISSGLYELALNPDIQAKVRQDVTDVLQTTGGKVTYDCLKEMKYLDQFYHEVLRKYPPVLYISRKAARDCTLGDSKVNLAKGTEVYIPVYAIHHDPNIYPNPQVFDPERFTEEAKKSRHPMHYLPFGNGPRNCIGARFANIQVKVGLIKILKNFRLDVCEKTQIPYIINRKSLFMLQPDHPVYVKMTKLEEK